MFRTLVGTRGQEINVDHVRALNLIDIDFYGVAKVLESWRAYKAHLSSAPGDRPMTPDENAKSEGARADHLARLLHRMADYLGFNMGELDLRRSGYAPSGWAYRDNQEAAFKTAVINCLGGQVPLKVRAEPPAQ